MNHVWTTLYALLSNRRRMRKEKHGMDGGKVDCHSFLLALGQEVLREDREILRNNNIYVGPGVEKLQSCCTR